MDSLCERELKSGGGGRGRLVRLAEHLAIEWYNFPAGNCSKEETMGHNVRGLIGG